MNDKGLRRFATGLAVVLGLLVSIAGTASRAQDGFFQPIELGSGGPTAAVVTTSAVFTVDADGKQGRLYVRALLAPGWHIYSTTQKPGGPVTTQIKIDPTTGVTVGNFTTEDKPHTAPEAAFDNMLVETHEGQVTWTAPLTVSAGTEPAKLELKGAVFAQACSNSCLPPQDYKFTAKKGTPADLEAVALGADTISLPGLDSVTSTSSGPPMPSAIGGPPMPGGVGAGLPAGLDNILNAAASAQGEYVPKASKLTLQAELKPGAVQPGQKARILITAKPQEAWHVYYAIVRPLPDIGNQATSLVFSETSGLQGGFLNTDKLPVAPKDATSSLPYFEQPVTWWTEIDVPADAKPGDYKLAGTLGFQTCKESCLQPEAVKWETSLTVAAAAPVDAPAKPVRFLEAAYYRDHAKAFNAVVERSALPEAAVDLANLQVADDEQGSSIVWMLLVAFGAGLILNIMPCVLPVIGLKVMSFVEQSGNDRKRILTLNIWYALGMLVVFWVLATVPVVLRVFFNQSFGWGQQFSFDGFNITLAAIVFVMALSFLGVWEIPIPGFAGGNSAQKLAEKEGASGAFIKGIITTLLATPCSGPGLATAVGFALRENVFVTYAIFTAMGLGMAAPYLAIGAKPSLLKFLPRPGEWMDTFKQIMGFMLLGTVVWLLMALPVARLIPTIAFLFALWAGCWWIGRVPVFAESSQKFRAWGQALAWSALLGWFAYTKLQGVIDYRVERFVDAQLASRLSNTSAVAAEKPKPVDSLPWQHFTIPALEQSLRDGQTVMVDFTADWCATCKVLKEVCLDVPGTKQVVEELGVVTYEADMTKWPPELAELLKKLRQGSVPVIAIFSAERPNEPVVFSGSYTQTQILDALRKAGPSRLKGDPKVTMR